MNKIKYIVVLLITVLAVTGCNTDKTKNPEPVEVLSMTCSRVSDDYELEEYTFMTKDDNLTKINLKAVRNQITEDKAQKLYDELTEEYNDTEINGFTATVDKEDVIITLTLIYDLEINSKLKVIFDNTTELEEIKTQLESEEFTCK